MKILLSVPGQAHTIPMKDFAHKALVGLGHQVITHNHECADLIERIYKKTLTNAFWAMKNQSLVELATIEKPDLVIAIYGVPISADTLMRLKKMGIRLACWWLNDPFQPAYTRIPIQSYDLCFTNSLYTQPDYEKAGVKNFHFLPVGIDPDTHKPLSVPKKHELLFMGDWHPAREELLDRLSKNIRISIAGPWLSKLSKKSPLRNLVFHNGFFNAQQMNHEYNQAYQVLNLHTWFGRFDYGLNPRVFEAAGAGAFQLCDHKTELPDMYVAGKHMSVYHNLDELEEQINWYAQKQELTQAMGAEAAAHSLKHHTYTHRMSKLIDIVNRIGFN